MNFEKSFRKSELWPFNQTTGTFKTDLSFNFFNKKFKYINIMILAYFSSIYFINVLKFKFY